MAVIMPVSAAVPLKVRAFAPEPTSTAYNFDMSRVILAVAGALMLLSSPGLPARQPAAAPDDTARINAWFEKKYEEQLAFSPIQQTFLGRKSNAIDDMSLAAQDRQLAWLRDSVAELKKSFNYARLSPEAQTSYDLWVYQLQQAEAALPFRTNAYVFDQMSAIHAFLPQLIIAFHQVENAADLEAYVNRIRESGRRDRPADRDLEAERGRRRPPAAVCVRLRHRRVHEAHHRRAVRRERAPTARSGPTSRARSPTSRRRARLDAAKAKALLDDARAALTGPFRTAYQNLIAWQKEDRAKAPEKTSGVGTLAERRRVLPRAARQPDHDDALGRPDPPDRARRGRAAARRDGSDPEGSGLPGRPAGLLRGTSRQEGRRALLLP